MISELLNDNYTPEEAESLQVRYRKRSEKEAIKKLTLKDVNEIKYIVGVDVSYFTKNEKELGIACAVLWDIKKNELIESTYAKNKIRFPYIPGLLGFRECRLMAHAILKLPKKYDLIMTDGHGIIHPRRFGEAVQLGVALDIPTIGVAKNPFIGYSKWKSLQRIKGNKSPIWNDNPILLNSSEQELLGYAICLKDHSKPVFVSEGYKVDIKLAINLALEVTIKHRLPEPLFLADKFSRRKITS
jgi:deoxyribonuclease V